MVFAGLLSCVLVAIFSTAAAAPRPRALCPDGVNSAANPACCSLFAVRDGLVNDIFEGTCGELAHRTLRLAFNDAIGFSTSNSSLGNGADGSIITFLETELLFAANVGVDDIVADILPFANFHRLSFGDAIHFAASVALTQCPGAPTVQTFVGRPNATTPSADGLIPRPSDDGPTILARMADAGFTPEETVALLARHSTGEQFDINPAQHREPFDSTPSEFDAQFFLEVLLKGTENVTLAAGQAQSPLPGEFREQSDFALARDPATACTWQSFVGDQALMASSFGSAMAKLALLGQDVSTLTDCTEVLIPAGSTAPTASFPPGKTIDDIDQSCAVTPFPAVPTQTGDPITVAPVPPQ